jgi:outer membrane protein OmpA-like peptidoglycan-associated protein
VSSIGAAVCLAIGLPAAAQCVPAATGQPSIASLERSFSDAPTFATAISAVDQILASGGSSADARLWSERARSTSKPGCERASALLRLARAARISGDNSGYRRLLKQSHDEFPLPEVEQALLAAPRPTVVAADDISRALSTRPMTRGTRDLVVVPDPDDSQSIDLAINFDSDSARLNQQGVAQLRELATALRTLHAPRVRVTGHTDLRGSAEYNMTLSIRRAEAVRAALVERYGFPAEDIETEGRGLEEPIVNGHTAAHDALNRRVEVQALP